MLTELAKSGDDFADSLQIFLTFPFIDAIVGKNPQQARDLHMGDYTNLSTSTSTWTCGTILHRDRHPGAAADADPGRLPLPNEPAAQPSRRADSIPGTSPGSGSARRRAAAVAAAAAAVCPTCRASGGHRSGEPQDRPTGPGDGIDTDLAAMLLRGVTGAMITARTKIQLLVFVVITLLGVTFVGARYARLDRLSSTTPTRSPPHFDHSGGIFTGAEVTYRGVTVGQV